MELSVTLTILLKKTMTRTNEIMRSLKEALENHSHLYSDEELAFMKRQLRSLNESRQQLLKEEKNGFGS